MDNVGTVPAALTAYLAIQAFRPDIVISAGTAGGFRSRGAAIADVFVSTGMVNHDRRIPIPVRPAPRSPACDARAAAPPLAINPPGVSPVPRLQGFDKYGIGAFDAVPTPHLQKALSLKSGAAAGRDSAPHAAAARSLWTSGPPPAGPLLRTRRRGDERQFAGLHGRGHGAHGAPRGGGQGVAPAVGAAAAVSAMVACDTAAHAAMQEMEAAAVAWSADLFGCPVFCIKSVTDIVDGERPAQVRRRGLGGPGQRGAVASAQPTLPLPATGGIP